LKIMIIGLGSMGKRRIRNLLALGEKQIYGFDIKKHRIEEAVRLYNIEPAEKTDIISTDDVDVLFICVPPAQHLEYIKLAVENKKHCFIEASVVSDGLIQLADEIDKTDLKVYASCTLRFHPAVKKIKELINGGAIGTVSNFSYHSGQYLPDWHPWEDIRDYYVSSKSTGGCREIVPFECSWLNDIFGKIKKVTGIYGKTIDLGVDIDDVYAVAMQYKSGVIGTLLVDVVSRFAVRQMIINGDKGQILWDWNSSDIKLYSSDNAQWESYEITKGKSADGYNKNITEDMYVEEAGVFLDSIRKRLPVYNSLRDDIYTLNCLYSVENSQNLIANPLLESD